METFYLDDNEDVVFEVMPDGSVQKIWPIIATTDLTKNDLMKWLEEDIKEGLNSEFKPCNINKKDN